MKKIALLLVVIVLAGGAYSLLHKKSSSDDLNPTPSPTVSVSESATPTPSGSASAQGATKTFTIKGHSFAFDPAQITVNKGDHVKIVFQDDDGFHDLVVEGYNVHTTRISTGQSSSVEFTADKTGTFAYYCSVGDHRAEGMQGTLVVK